MRQITANAIIWIEDTSHREDFKDTALSILNTSDVQSSEVLLGQYRTTVATTPDPFGDHIEEAPIQEVRPVEVPIVAFDAPHSPIC